MEFNVSSSALLKQLSNLSGALSNSNALPILDNFLFSLSKNKLQVSASDLETTITTTLIVESKDEDSIAIPARLLLEMLKAMPDQPLTFSVDKKKFAITVSSGQGAYKLTGHDAADFPKVQEIESSSSFEIDANTLSKSIGKTLFATGTDDLRPAMCGVYVQMDKGSVIFVATDAHKLVRYKRNDVKSDKVSSFIIPKKPLSLLKGVLGDGKVKVEYNNTNVSFTTGNSVLICRLIDAKFPNYEAVIPKENPNVLTIDRNALANSVKRISIFANKTTSQVKLIIKGKTLTVSAEDLDFSNEASEKLTCQYKGEDMEIGFNAKLLAEILSNIDGDEVTVEMSQPNRAGIVKSTVVNKEDDALMLLMPVLLQN